VPAFVTRSEIPVPPAVVFAHLVDLDSWSSFRGWGPLPGIVSATIAQGSSETGRLALGARVRVENTDGSVHHEIVEEFDPPSRYRVRMELVPPASRILARIDEAIDLELFPNGTRVRRSFVVTPRSRWTAPLAWLIARLFLRRAVEVHDRAVAATLREQGARTTSGRLL
jgi:hypothetical protein